MAMHPSPVLLPGNTHGRRSLVGCSTWDCWGLDWAASLSLFTFMRWRRKWQPTPVLLPGESHGRRSLVGCSPWGLYELDTTGWLHFRFSLSCVGEGNGNPLQCSCLENPRDGGAWWAAVYGVAQSRTRLKWLSSSHPYINWVIFHIKLIACWFSYCFITLVSKNYIPVQYASLSHNLRNCLSAIITGERFSKIITRLSWWLSDKESSC